ncbi:hypothetical protein PVK64_17925 [Aliivibrio sp. S4TY2]|uniref:hypothetical protein n=1 Tax=unclassified Aliivibrio TaxID=2645654 RepID=UPI0023796ECD|nr:MULTISPECIES: hypothetical protein [unclassified Aliivibrio]MDD9158045.1 hypothetical protein [Aliivibrio sp. S4TY2]MDD9161912.1 hypothetical protein [Aliivibrio sp. S4TY1]MDD9166042.1 hypothetical protein [Aliivibrio sp. S4MY2]MDD9169992.1 hypothetical protein [Aliivibrio sp. S4MY4]MDD9187043.1 hypothetical protein [Aliivibrio sp. S4MY3]
MDDKQVKQIINKLDAMFFQKEEVSEIQSAQFNQTISTMKRVGDKSNNILSAINKSIVSSNEVLIDSVDRLIEKVRELNVTKAPVVTPVNNNVVVDNNSIADKMDSTRRTTELQQRERLKKSQKTEQKFFTKLISQVISAGINTGQRIIKQLTKMVMLQSIMTAFSGAISTAMKALLPAIILFDKTIGRLINPLLDSFIDAGKAGVGKLSTKVSKPDIDIDVKGLGRQLSTMLGTTMRSVITSVGPRLVALANPVSLVIGAVASLGYGMYKLFEDEFDKIFSSVKSLLIDPERLSNLMAPVVAWFDNIVSSVTGTFSNLTNQFVSNLTELKDNAVQFFADLGITKFFNTFFNTVLGVWNGIISTFLNIPDYLSKLNIKMDQLILNMKLSLQNTINGLIDNVNAVSSKLGLEIDQISLVDDADKAQQKLLEAEAELNKRISERNNTEYVQETAKFVADGVSDTAKKTVDGLKDSADLVVDMTTEFVKETGLKIRDAKNGFSESLLDLSDDINSLGIESPDFKPVNDRPDLGSMVSKQATQTEKTAMEVQNNQNTNLLNNINNSNNTTISTNNNSNTTIMGKNLFGDHVSTRPRGGVH